MMSCRAVGSGTTGKRLPVVRLTTSAGVTSSSSPSDASMAGQMTVRSPRLAEFWRKMRAKPVRDDRQVVALQARGGLLA